MSEFDWTYDIPAEVIYVGSKFRIDASTVEGSEFPLDNWANGEFIEFELSWIGINRRDDGRLHLMDYIDYGEVVNLVINDCKMPENSIYSPGYQQIVEKGRVQELVNSGYWVSI